MYKINKVTKQVEEEEVEDIICNKCGSSCKVSIAEEIDTYEDIAIEHGFGYGTERDGELHVSHLCYECYDKLIASFVYPPTIEELGGW